MLAAGVGMHYSPRLTAFPARHASIPTLVARRAASCLLTLPAGLNLVQHRQSAAVAEIALLGLSALHALQGLGPQRGEGARGAASGARQQLHGARVLEVSRAMQLLLQSAVDEL
jgi:hypothetical protein